MIRSVILLLVCLLSVAVSESAAAEAVYIRAQNTDGSTIYVPVQDGSGSPTAFRPVYNQGGGLTHIMVRLSDGSPRYLPVTPDREGTVYFRRVAGENGKPQYRYYPNPPRVPGETLDRQAELQQTADQHAATRVDKTRTVRDVSTSSRARAADPGTATGYERLPPATKQPVGIGEASSHGPAGESEVSGDYMPGGDGLRQKEDLSKADTGKTYIQREIYVQEDSDAARVADREIYVQKQDLNKDRIQRESPATPVQKTDVIERNIFVQKKDTNREKIQREVLVKPVGEAGTVDREIYVQKDGTGRNLVQREIFVQEESPAGRYVQRDVFPAGGADKVLIKPVVEREILTSLPPPGGYDPTMDVADDPSGGDASDWESAADLLDQSRTARTTGTSVSGDDGGVAIEVPAIGGDLVARTEAEREAHNRRQGDHAGRDESSMDTGEPTNPFDSLRDTVTAVADAASGINNTIDQIDTLQDSIDTFGDDDYGGHNVTPVVPPTAGTATSGGHDDGSHGVPPAVASTITPSSPDHGGASTASTPPYPPPGTKTLPTQHTGAGHDDSHGGTTHTPSPPATKDDYVVFRHVDFLGVHTRSYVQSRNTTDKEIFRGGFATEKAAYQWLCSQLHVTYQGSSAYDQTRATFQGNEYNVRHDISSYCR